MGPVGQWVGEVEASFETVARWGSTALGVVSKEVAEGIAMAAVAKAVAVAERAVAWEGRR